ITRGMYKKYIFFLCVFYSLINGFLIKYISLSEAHIDYFCTIIYRVAYAVCDILISLIPIGNHTHAHNLHIISYAVDANSVMALSTDNSRYVRSMIRIGPFNVGISVKALICVFIIIANDVS